MKIEAINSINSLQAFGEIFPSPIAIIKENGDLIYKNSTFNHLIDSEAANLFSIISSESRITFNNFIKETLKELGYSIHYKVLDGKHFVPQHRERIIIVGFRRDKFNDLETFEFPQMILS